MIVSCCYFVNWLFLFQNYHVHFIFGCPYIHSSHIYIFFVSIFIRALIFTLVSCWRPVVGGRTSLKEPGSHPSKYFGHITVKPKQWVISKFPFFFPFLLFYTISLHYLIFIFIFSNRKMQFRHLIIHSRIQLHLIWHWSGRDNKRSGNYVGRNCTR